MFYEHHMLATAGYAGLAALYGISLTLDVVRLRNKLQVSLGDGTREQVLELLTKYRQDPAILDDAKQVSPFGSKYYRLTRAVRIHGNYMEVAPITLLLVGLAEYNGMDTLAVHGIMLTFLVTRVLHRRALRDDATAAGRNRLYGTSAYLLLTIGIASWNVWKVIAEPAVRAAWSAIQSSF
ncbi:membrane-associated, eicosanoid/glutathione metabolism protein [Entophlyctis helioformis]|nr:membrane-associated, eicosanoid/glutathione metabolism protein [Entophlyctis helioformis]